MAQATDVVRTFAVETEPAVSGVVRDILVRRISERCGAIESATNPGVRIRFGIDPTLRDQAFRIDSPRPGEIRIASDHRLGLLAGAGKFLRTCSYSEQGFTPSTWRGTSAPMSKLRGMYFATHFFNWYHVAPEAELERYLEDIALWGCSQLWVIYPIVNIWSWDDPQSDEAFARIHWYAKACQRLGMEVGIGWPINQDFKTPRPEFRATPNRDDLGRKGNHGNNICPSLPGAMEYIEALQDEYMRRLEGTGIRMFVFWPYDEGGCGCDACFPWGANGYLRLCRRSAEKIRKRIPDAELVLSTWVYDTPPAGEWEGLARDLKERGNYVDYILADAHEDFPRYPLEKGVPGGLPLINFPEISMWALWPWGGFGAAVLPARFQRLWDQVKHVVRGGFPYSEGLFEDMNKAIVSQFYWGDTPALDTLREYANYEFIGADPERIVSIVQGIEENHTISATSPNVDLPLAERVLAEVKEVDATLSAFARASWRWRILYLRAVLDRERYAAKLREPDSLHKSWGDLVAGNPVAEEAFRELIEIFRCRPEPETVQLDHNNVRPPLRPSQGGKILQSHT